MKARAERSTLAAFLLGALLAGGNGVAIRFSNRELDPLWGACVRFALAGAILLGVMALMRLALPRGRALAGALLFGLLQFGATFALMYYALVELYAGFAQIILALVPLLTLFLAISERQEHFRVDALIGGMVALAGIALMSGAALPSPLPLTSILAALGSALCFAQAAVLVRFVPRVHPVTMNAVGMTAGTVVLLAMALVVGETLSVPDTASTWSAVLYLATFGSVAVFLLYLFVLRRWEASRAAYSFVLIPVATVVLSAWLDDEPIGAGLVGGGVVVLGGVYVGALRSSPEPVEG